MHFTTEEFAALAKVEAPAPRKDLYAFIHKALRGYLADGLLALGRLDVNDANDLAQTCHHVLELLDFCCAHLGHENRFIHPALQQRAVGSADIIAAEHLEHERAIAALKAGIDHLLACAPAQRVRLSHALYHQMALFVAHNLAHMYAEETVHNAVLWQHYDDAELTQIENDLLAHLSPEVATLCLRWMLPHLTPSERAELLGGMRDHASPEAFEAALLLARTHLDTSGWNKLMRDLDSIGTGHEST